MSFLAFEHVFFENNGTSILNNISLQFEQGDFISIVGPSGSGKSTLLKLCSHLISPTAGTIYFKNQNITTYNPTILRKSIVYCFQTPYLFGNTVKENIQFPFLIRNKKIDLKRVHDLFHLFHMAPDYLEKDVQNLSGGEKQRIALIRSLLFKPEVLLLDEVTSALDPENTEILEQVIASLNTEGTTILWITHNLAQSRKYANKVLSIAHGKVKSLEVIK